MEHQSPGVPGPSKRQRNIPSQMEEPARCQLLAPMSGVASSRPSGPSESDMLSKPHEFARANPWANRLLANLELVAERLQGYDGAEDTPHATDINRDEHSVSAPLGSPALRRER